MKVIIRNCSITSYQDKADDHFECTVALILMLTILLYMLQAFEQVSHTLAVGRFGKVEYVSDTEVFLGRVGLLGSSASPVCRRTNCSVLHPTVICKR
jgi:hypothetical protein